MRRLRDNVASVRQVASERLRLGTRPWALSPHALLLTLVVVLAALVRMLHVGATGLRGDEAVYAGQAGVLAGQDDMNRHFLLVSRGNSNFLLFQELLSVIYRFTGPSDLAARLLSATFSTLTVVVVYWLARVLYGRWTGLIAALLLALSGYSVLLGRLALLDSTHTFLVSLSLLWLVVWRDSGQPRWFYAFTATVALAMQAKVTSVLVLVIAALYLLSTDAHRRLDRRTVGIGAAVFAAACLPVLVQLVTMGDLFWRFLASSSLRKSDVPADYYVDTLLKYEGVAVVAVVLLGVLGAAFRRSRRDLLPVLWCTIYASFVLAYPLKAFNYLLPLVPPLTILAARTIAGLRLPWRALPRVTAPVAALALVAAFALSGVDRAMDDKSFAGLREAARWLQTNGDKDAGVITISHGSAQYVFPFYAGLDSYPFGRFRLDTMLPGGTIVRAAPPPDGSTPRDWVSEWPPRLVESGKVSYAVFYISPPRSQDDGEDPPLVRTATERLFRGLIESYGGQLVHTVTTAGRPRAWIYQLTKRLPRPVLHYTRDGAVLHLRGDGFVRNAPVTVTYNEKTLTRTRADAAGSVAVDVGVPIRTHPRQAITATDAFGNSASVDGLASAQLLYFVSDGRVELLGAGFTPRDEVTIRYNERVVAHAHAGEDGSFRTSLPLPTRTQPRYRFIAADTSGRHAQITGLPTPTLRYLAQGRQATVEGSGFTAGRAIRVGDGIRTVCQARVRINGTFSCSFSTGRVRVSRLVAVDALGRRAAL